MASGKRVLIIIHDDSDEEARQVVQKKQDYQPETPVAPATEYRPVMEVVQKEQHPAPIALLTKESFSLQFFVEAERMNQEGTIDPDMYNWYKSIEEGTSKYINASDSMKNKNKTVAEVLLFRGPRAVFHDFDELCMFGNDMYLTNSQQKWLKNWCNTANANKFQMKFYIHRMTNSNIIEGKSKMDIGAKFSKTYLHAHLEVARMVPVNSNVSTKTFYMKVKRGKGKNTVMMTKNWSNAVIEYKIKEKDIWLFNFSAKQTGELEVRMVPLP